MYQLQRIETILSCVDKNESFILDINCSKKQGFCRYFWHKFARCSIYFISSLCVLNSLTINSRCSWIPFRSLRTRRTSYATIPWCLYLGNQLSVCGDQTAFFSNELGIVSNQLGIVSDLLGKLIYQCLQCIHLGLKFILCNLESKKLISV